MITIRATFPTAEPSAHEIVLETTAIVERMLPGIPETMRACAQEETHLAMLDRSVAGIRGRSLIINLPEGAAACGPTFSRKRDRNRNNGTYHCTFVWGNKEPRLSDVLEFIEPTSTSHRGHTTPQVSSQTTEDKSGSIHHWVKPCHHVESKLDPSEFAEFLSRRSTLSDDATRS